MFPLRDYSYAHADDGNVKKHRICVLAVSSPFFGKANGIDKDTLLKKLRFVCWYWNRHSSPAELVKNSQFRVSLVPIPPPVKLFWTGTLPRPHSIAAHVMRLLALHGWLLFAAV